VILTDFRPQHDIVTHVLRTYRREARDWARAHGSAPAGESPRAERPPAAGAGEAAGTGPAGR
jgi:hypothetical protein